MGMGRVQVIKGRPVRWDHREQEKEECETVLKRLVGPDLAGVL